MTKLELYGLCAKIAEEAHKGQVDKAGKPYIEHLTRVSDRCFADNLMFEDKFALELGSVAILHDVLEDTSVTEQDLADQGVPDFIIEGVKSVTRGKDESYGDFVKRASTNALGIWVKYFDLTDNLDITRLQKIDESDIDRINKYLKWYHYLKKKLSEIYPYFS